METLPQRRQRALHEAEGAIVGNVDCRPLRGAWPLSPISTTNGLPRHHQRTELPQIWTAGPPTGGSFRPKNDAWESRTFRRLPLWPVLWRHAHGNDIIGYTSIGYCKLIAVYRSHLPPQHDLTFAAEDRARRAEDSASRPRQERTVLVRAGGRLRQPGRRATTVSRQTCRGPAAARRWT